MKSTALVAAIFLLAGLTQGQLNRLYRTDKGKVDLESMTTPLVDNTAFG